MRISKGLLIPAVTAFLMFSCTGSAPVIEEMKWRILYRDDGQNRYEELSVFFRARDPDGVEDLASVSVMAGESGFIWDFPEDKWIRLREGGADWQGLPGIIPLTGFRLPDALYTFRLEDLAGRIDEITFRPDPDRLTDDELIWPEVRIEENLLHLDGPFSRGMLILRDENLGFLESGDVSDGTVVDAGDAVFWELWIPLVDTSGGFRLGPYPFVNP